MTIEWSIPGKASVLVGGQFGSEAKGASAAWLAGRVKNISIASCASGAQAGHTSQYRDGRRWICYHLPTHAVARPGTLSYCNAGAIVDVDLLEREISDCGIDPTLVLVHPRAAVITEEDRIAESDPGAPTRMIGSTMKGVGSALSRKIWRKSPLIQGIDHPPWMRVGTIDLNERMLRGDSIVLETPQGVGLGINQGFAYPTCTTRDCYVTSSLEYSGVHPHFLGPTALIIRTYPIRVGHIIDANGEVIGNSGPFWDDSREMSWDEFPGVVPEITTVTKRVRRIATFSKMQYRHALMLNRPTIVMVTFTNYLSSAELFIKFVNMLRQIEWTAGWPWRSLQHVYGFSPNTEDFTDDIDAAISWFDNRTPTW